MQCSVAPRSLLVLIMVLIMMLIMMLLVHAGVQKQLADCTP